MPRKNRYFTVGRLWHVTHRCHNRDFLLRLGRDRDAYRSLLREKVRGAGVDLYAYCLTSNHVHILLRSSDGERIAPLMKSVAGEFAQAYNRRKGRSGAYWGDRYHATMIDSDEYLWRCLQYIDLNKEFVERMAGTLRNRRALEFVEPQAPGAPFVLRERAASYATA